MIELIAAHRLRPRLSGRPGRASRWSGSRLRRLRIARFRSSRSYGAGRDRRREALADGLRPVEGSEAERTLVGLAVGQGPPGWHIECSAMSLDLLGDSTSTAEERPPLPAHENERAGRAAGHEFARHWLHSGMVPSAARRWRSRPATSSCWRRLGHLRRPGGPVVDAPDALRARLGPPARRRRRRVEASRRARARRPGRDRS